MSDTEIDTNDTRFRPMKTERDSKRHIRGARDTQMDKHIKEENSRV